MRYKQSLWLYCLNPIHWPLMLMYYTTWLFVQLPRFIAVPLLLGLVKLIKPLLFKRRLKHIETNIGLCFPELTLQQKTKMASTFFNDLILSYYDCGKIYKRLYHNKIPHKISGIEHIQQALSLNKGVILLGGHFNSIFLAPYFIRKALGQPLSNMYQEMKNPFFRWRYEQIQRSYFNPITKRNIRGMIDALAANQPVLYYTDLNDRRGKTFAPFFGIPAATNTAISRIAELSGCQVLPFSCFRLPGKQGYEVTIYPALTAFPCGDSTQDVTRTNKIIEDFVRQHPEQYLWLHRRFKKRPKGEPGLY